MPRKPGLTPVVHPFKPGDVVAALTNTKHVPEGSVGRVAILSATGHPIVDFPARGRVLITAAELVAHDGPLPTTNPDRVPLRDVPTPREVVPVDEPPVAPDPDWCEPPDAAYLKRPVVVQAPTSVWNPMPARAGPNVVVRNPESHPTSNGARSGWTEERREKFRATMELKRTAKEQERENVEPTTQPAAESPRAALAPTPEDAARAAGAPADTPAQSRDAPPPPAVALMRPNLLDAPPDTLTIGRLPQRVMTPVSHDPNDERAFEIVSTRRVLSLAATRGLGSRTVLELARLLCQLDDEAAP